MTVPKSAEELELTRALHQQRATVEILKIISSSRSDARPVFEQIVRSAVALCRGLNGVVYRYDGTMIHVMAHHNFTVEAIEGLCECRLHPERTFKVRLSGKFVLEGGNEPSPTQTVPDRCRQGARPHHPEIGAAARG